MCTTGGAACMKPATQRAPLMVFSSIYTQPLVRYRETDQPASQPRPISGLTTVTQLGCKTSTVSL